MTVTVTGVRTGVRAEARPVAPLPSVAPVAPVVPIAHVAPIASTALIGKGFFA